LVILNEISSGVRYKNSSGVNADFFRGKCYLTGILQGSLLCQEFFRDMVKPLSSIGG
jgi:hypothetical protein